MFLLFQIKRLKDLEKEKDALWTGLEILEKARVWYLQRLEENSARQGGAAEVQRLTDFTDHNALKVSVWSTNIKIP